MATSVLDASRFGARPGTAQPHGDHRPPQAALGLPKQRTGAAEVGRGAVLLAPADGQYSLAGESRTGASGALGPQQGDHRGNRCRRDQGGTARQRHPEPPGKADGVLGVDRGSGGEDAQHAKHARTGYHRGPEGEQPLPGGDGPHREQDVGRNQRRRRHARPHPAGL
jgi:hypothetical protein